MSDFQRALSAAAWWAVFVIGAWLIVAGCAGLAFP